MFDVYKRMFDCLNNIQSPFLTDEFPMFDIPGIEKSQKQQQHILDQYTIYVRWLKALICIYIYI